MTQQEFVNKESEEYVDNSKPVERDECSWQVVDESFSDGLTKGLEIGKEFLDWLIGHYHYSGGEWYVKCSKSMVSFTTDELLTIFLTEKYGQ